MSFYQQFKVPVGQELDLNNYDPAFTLAGWHKKTAKKMIVEYGQRLRALQYRLYAENKRSLLIVLQGMDASGKDGSIRHVLGYMNPQGCRVKGFKQPSTQEKAHDFLWRVHRNTPAIGEVVVFNRSHYEDVLVTRVHGWIDEKNWQQRYQQINAFEALLAHSNTIILKFFLHISPEEQLKRFEKRLKDPARWWKISEADYREREYWQAYQQAYQDVLQQCNQTIAPWFIVPSDHKWFRNLVIVQIVVETLEKLKMTFPEPVADIVEIKRKYHQWFDEIDTKER